jgi:hypothetical protein
MCVLSDDIRDLGRNTARFIVVRSGLHSLDHDPHSPAGRSVVRKYLGFLNKKVKTNKFISLNRHRRGREGGGVFLS